MFWGGLAGRSLNLRWVAYYTVDFKRVCLLPLYGAVFVCGWFCFVGLRVFRVFVMMVCFR